MAEMVTEQLAVNPEPYKATAVVISGAEYDELWTRIVAAYPFFADHQAQVTRRIPVVALVHA